MNSPELPQQAPQGRRPIRRGVSMLRAFIALCFQNPKWTAISIVTILTLWIVSGIIRDTGNTPELALPIAQRTDTAQIFRVTIRSIYAVTYQKTLTLQARTEADRSVTIAAETPGIISRLPIAEGTAVKKGQIICQIETNARAAGLAEARANQQARKIDFEAAQKLHEKGHSSKSQVAVARAAYDAARAFTKSRQIELENTKIRAPFDGILDVIPVEVGDFINVGTSCGTILDKNPLIAVAHVSENEIADIYVGAKGHVQLVTGEHVEGIIRYVAEISEPTTRTFRIELELNNDDARLRDGISAKMSIVTREVQASQIPQSVMTLNADGQIGIRAVNGRDKVIFRPIKIINDGTDGAWVQGLAEEEKVIIVGQDFVRTGQKVTPVIENAAYEIPAPSKSLDTIGLGKSDKIGDN